MKIITNGRTDLAEYFKQSGIREQRKRVHAPFLAFVTDGEAIEVRIIDNAKKLLELSDETQVMAQRQGKWRSDFFKFQVADLRQYVTQNPPQSYHVV